VANTLRIVIAGAGLGGLTAALSLLKSGFDVDVYEQAPELKEVGAGVQISANGTRVLHALGLGDALRALSWEPKGKEYRLWNTGETWPMFDLGAESVERYGFPYYMFHRADLHDALAAGVRRAKRSAIHLGAKVVGCDVDGVRPALRLENGTRIAGDVVVGADGVHSEVRQALFGPDRPKFTGCIAWRGVIPRERLPQHLLRPVGANWMGPGGHIVHYFLRRGELLNFVGVRERQDWQIESWIAAGTVAECLNDFRGWHDDIQTMIRNIDTPYKWALKVREPMQRWTKGRVTLLGDACHSTLPFMAQGAVMAIEDGFILARCLAAAPGDPEAGLIRYEAARRERANKVVTGSARMTDLFHNAELATREGARAFLASQFQPEQTRERYEWLFAYDATRVAV
jgi:salicylate hydroxylase